MWKVIVVRELLAGTKRYSELHRGLKHATHKMLAQQLRQLEADGILDRKVYPQVPPKVEYLADPARPRAGSAARCDVRVGPSRHRPHRARVASGPGDRLEVPCDAAADRHDGDQLIGIRPERQHHPRIGEDRHLVAERDQNSTTEERSQDLIRDRGRKDGCHVGP